MSIGCATVRYLLGTSRPPMVNQASQYGAGAGAAIPYMEPILGTQSPDKGKVTEEKPTYSQVSFQGIIPRPRKLARLIGEGARAHEAKLADQ